MDFSISSIKRFFAGIDYAWQKPPTYLVFVPIISLIIQKIQFDQTVPLLPRMESSFLTQKSEETEKITEVSRKFAAICKWHLRGGMVQLLALATAVKVKAVSRSSLVLLIAYLVTSYELFDTLYKSIKNRITLYEFYPNGHVKKVSWRSACNIF